MSLLLDSNVLLWWFENSPRLRPDVLKLVCEEKQLLVSIVTPWELWIKAAQGKLRMPDDLESRLARDQIELVHPTLSDARLAAHLPMLHRDPFDRMIIAQALNRQAPIVTGDARLSDYGAEVVLV